MNKMTRNEQKNKIKSQQIWTNEVKNINKSYIWDRIIPLLVRRLTWKKNWHGIRDVKKTWSSYRKRQGNWNVFFFFFFCFVSVFYVTHQFVSGYMTVLLLLDGLGHIWTVLSSDDLCPKHVHVEHADKQQTKPTPDEQRRSAFNPHWPRSELVHTETWMWFNVHMEEKTQPHYGGVTPKHKPSFRTEDTINRTK